MTLLNGTLIPYSQLTIPCCQTCNTGALSDVEKEVAVAFELGPDEVEQLPKETLFIWLAKFYYGLLYRELSLYFDRSSGSEEMILSEEKIREFAMHHLFLRRAIGKVDWSDFPATIRVFRAQEPESDRDGFDYIDSFDAPFVAIRSGSTIVVALLQDFGALEATRFEELPWPRAARELELHPFQCIEVFTFYLVAANLRTRAPKFLVWKTDDAEDCFSVQLLPQGGLSGRPPYREWDDELFFVALAQVLGNRGFEIDREFIQRRPTMLFDNVGEVLQPPSADSPIAKWT